MSKDVHSKLKKYCEENKLIMYAVIDKAVSKELGI